MNSGNPIGRLGSHFIGHGILNRSHEPANRDRICDSNWRSHLLKSRLEPLPIIYPFTPQFPMHNSLRLAIACTILFFPLASMAGTDKKLALPQTPPNKQIDITKQSGTCPTKIGMWNILRQYEGGYEQSEIVDLVPITGTVTLKSSSKKFALYTAKLKPKYARCVGNGVDETGLFRAKFTGGNLNFRVQLPADTPEHPSVLMVRSFVGNRPYIKWQIAD
jgi:hypothetical protein